MGNVYLCATPKPFWPIFTRFCLQQDDVMCTYSTAQTQRHLARVQTIKTLANKRRGTHFARKYSSQTKWEEYLQVKWVSHPLISEFYNRFYVNTYMCPTY